jgi:tetratricopeptide (TPR) repeat protein
VRLERLENFPRNPLRSGAVTRLFTGLWLLIAVGLAAPPAVAAPDRREMQAREAFAAGRYQEALDLFVKLYAEQLHPNYLRNIGRCYQDLGDPDRAISSFHEYLRKAKDVSPTELKEINGYIAEMEDLKKRQQQPADQKAAQLEPLPKKDPAANASPTSLPVPAPASASPPGGQLAVAAPSAPPPAAQPLVLLVEPQAPPPRDDGPPVYGRWWFWAIVGGVVAAGVVGAAAAGVFTTRTDATCPAGRLCR